MLDFCRVEIAEEVVVTARAPMSKSNRLQDLFIFFFFLLSYVFFSAFVRVLKRDGKV